MGAENVVATIVTCRTSGIGVNRIPQQFQDAKVHCQLSYIADSLDSGSTIKIARLPPGALVLLFALRNAACTNAVTGLIGDGGDADRWVVAGGITSLAAAGQQLITPRQGDYTLSAAGVLTAGTVGWGYLTTDWTDVFVTTGGANMAAGDPRIDFATFYTLLG